MSAKHTPGPWKVIPDFVAREVDVFEIAEISHYRVICDGRGDGYAVAGDAHSDARLISAAPELLAAIQDLLSACFEDGDDNVRDISDVLPAELISAARAAIAKATGAAS